MEKKERDERVGVREFRSREAKQSIFHLFALVLNQRSSQWDLGYTENHSWDRDANFFVQTFTSYFK